jgi:hypothetical protein
LHLDRDRVPAFWERAWSRPAAGICVILPLGGSGGLLAVP